MKNCGNPPFWRILPQNALLGGIGSPKPSIYAVLWKDFRPGPEKCPFSQKVALFAIFTLFAKITFFMIFMIFMKKQEFSNYAR